MFVLYACFMCLNTSRTTFQIIKQKQCSIFRKICYIVKRVVTPVSVVIYYTVFYQIITFMNLQIHYTIFMNLLNTDYFA